MTDLEWARAFVGCKIEGTGRRFAETVDVLVKKLAQVREEAAGDFHAVGGYELQGDPLTRPAPAGEVALMPGEPQRGVLTQPRPTAWVSGSGLYAKP
ncbi:MAG: hypothetical protein P4N24_17705 [Acidobacteriota bacterium]|nr:hypothetical protein [Acidobacteriota bacterium]